MTRRLYRVATLLGVLSLIPLAAEARQATPVTGQVTAQATGQPMAGVQIVAKGTTVGTLTDANGRYTLNVPSGATELVFSFLGYKRVEAQISGSVVNVAMEVEAINIDGVVVTALV
jgi:hypothetical protein